MAAGPGRTPAGVRHFLGASASVAAAPPHPSSPYRPHRPPRCGTSSAYGLGRTIGGIGCGRVGAPAPRHPPQRTKLGHYPRRRSPIRRGRPGLTVAELIGIVVFVAVLAALGMRQVAAARIIVREELALQNLRSMGRACQYYFRANSLYPADLRDLGPIGSIPPYLNELLAQRRPSVQGYEFVYVRHDPRSFTINANPSRPGQTGTRHFVIDHTDQVHSTRENRNATAGDRIED